MTKPTLALAATGLAAATLLTACTGSAAGPRAATPPSGSTSSETVTIASFDFPESTLLAEIYGDVLKARGVKVGYQPNVETRDALYKGLLGGEITLVPEYNGALLAYLDKNATATTTTDVDTALELALPSALEILSSAPAEDKESLTVTKAVATTNNLTKISDLTAFANSFTIGAAPEFKTRQQGLPGLTATYGLTFKAFKPLDNSGPTTEAALKSGEVQVADFYTTDPRVPANGFVTLQDDKNLFTAQNVTPLAFKTGLSEAEVLALDEASAKIDTATLAGLVRKIVDGHQNMDEVASAWVASVGLNK